MTERLIDCDLRDSITRGAPADSRHPEVTPLRSVAAGSASVPSRLEAVPEPPPRPAFQAAWEPLRIPMYRAFWAASLLSNLGTWIHEVGAAWLMTELDPSPMMVSSVRAVMALPLLLLALPAGVLADRVDRRRLLIATQCWMLTAAATLATLTLLGLVTPWVLLLLTGAIGLGMVLHGPTWQAAIPDLVPRRSLASAVALGSISFNLARTAGPALGGVMVAWLGSWSAFAVNSGSFLGVIGVLLFWKRTESESSDGRSFIGSLGDGLRFVGGSRTMRHVLARVILFVVPAGALWSLLPLVAHDMLGWGAVGYGVLVGGIGLGAVLAAVALPMLRYRRGPDCVVRWAHASMAIPLAIVATNPGGTAVALLMLLAGAGWMMALTTLNSTAQMTLPRKLRARGMACYLTSFAAAMSGGALLWGAVARRFDLSTAMAAAAAVMIASIALACLLPLNDDEAVDG